MEENRKDSIVYDEQWQRFDVPEVVENIRVEKHDDSKDRSFENNYRKTRDFPSLITIQLVITLLIAFLVFILKSMDADIYREISKWYNEQMQKTLVSDSTFEDIDLSAYLKASADEI